MRQKKPWEAIGMSRASWYRHGKPSEKPKRVTVADAARAAGASSKRTYQRIIRVMGGDMDLAVLMLEHGWCKPGQAEKIITNPCAHRAFRKMIKAGKSRQRGEQRR
jgi:hypothetical protein